MSVITYGTRYDTLSREWHRNATGDPLAELPVYNIGLPSNDESVVRIYIPKSVAENGIAVGDVVSYNSKKGFTVSGVVSKVEEGASSGVFSGYASYVPGGYTTIFFPNPGFIGSTFPGFMGGAITVQKPKTTTDKTTTLTDPHLLGTATSPHAGTTTKSNTKNFVFGAVVIIAFFAIAAIVKKLKEGKKS